MERGVAASHCYGGAGPAAWRSDDGGSGEGGGRGVEVESPDAILLHEK